jgi:S-formylglutathione hydrolase FrmB
MRIPCFAALLLIGLSCPSHAFKIDTEDVPSKAMNKPVPIKVIVPDRYRDGQSTLPVLYLLHGAGDKNGTCIAATSIPSLADQYGIIVVCPYAEVSWYFDSPEVPGSQYETIVSKELVAYMDSHYHTIADRRHRATMGNSMGGHGALFLAIRHRDVFGIASSMSGGVDFREFPDSWNLKSVLGTKQEHPDRWNDLTVLNQAKSLKDGELAISFECGVQDFFLPGNRALHQELLEQKVSHDYTERPGYHGWDYWPNAIKYQMLYVSEKFKEADAKK